MYLLHTPREQKACALRGGPMRLRRVFVTAELKKLKEQNNDDET